MKSADEIWQSANLPTLPVVAVRLIETSQDPNVGLRDIADIIKLDPAISAKILKIVNSPVYGFESTIKSIDEAVPLLGITVTRSIALTFYLAPSGGEYGDLEATYQQIWLQCLIHAVCAEQLAKRFFKDSGSEYFLCGLLADIGRFVLLRTIPDDYQAVVDLIDECTEEACSAERQLIGVDHVEVGYNLLRNWNLPTSICQAVRFHEETMSVVKSQRKSEAFDLIKTIRASTLIGNYFISRNKAQTLLRLRETMSVFFDMNANDLDEFLITINEKIEFAGKMFSLDTTEIPNPDVLMMQANEQIAQLAFVQQKEARATAEKNQQLESTNKVLSCENQMLQNKSTRDGLTGLFTRDYFLDATEQIISHSVRIGQSFAIIFADIDEFKVVNDTYGHQFGDQVLIGAANAFEGALRQSDIVARYGGEEFIIVTRNVTLRELGIVLERLRASLESKKFSFNNEQVTVTSSFGAYFSSPDRSPSQDLDAMIRIADEALYQSKRNGRNQFTIAEVGLTQQNSTVSPVNLR